MCSRNGVEKPSTVIFRCVNGLPRTLNSLRKIIGRRHAGKDLDGSEGIVGQYAAQVLDVCAPQHLLRRDARVGRPETIGRNGDVLRICACPLTERNRHNDAAARRDLHVAPDQDVADDGYVQAMRACADRCHNECTGAVRLR